MAHYSITPTKPFSYDDAVESEEYLEHVGNSWDTLSTTESARSKQNGDDLSSSALESPKFQNTKYLYPTDSFRSLKNEYEDPLNPRGNKKATSPKAKKFGTPPPIFDKNPGILSSNSFKVFKGILA
mmetsp:Transcript_31263/g.65216  ORF Transcript_31263/g.65216 Transcript_31263/m.65216 type:complete len:126 (+) Transcript_31263:1371-1748(+)